MGLGHTRLNQGIIIVVVFINIHFSVWYIIPVGDIVQLFNDDHHQFDQTQTNYYHIDHNFDHLLTRHATEAITEEAIVRSGYHKQQPVTSCWSLVMLVIIMILIIMNILVIIMIDIIHCIVSITQVLIWVRFDPRKKHRHWAGWESTAEKGRRSRCSCTPATTPPTPRSRSFCSIPPVSFLTKQCDARHGKLDSQTNLFVKMCTAPILNKYMTHKSHHSAR